MEAYGAKEQDIPNCAPVFSEHFPNPIQGAMRSVPKDTWPRGDQAPQRVISLS